MIKPLTLLAVALAGAPYLFAADAVELNGITDLGRAKLGCFLLYQPAASQPLNFTLLEGESKYGFKLISVDAKAHQALVEQCGVKKYVRINATPEVIATSQEGAAGTAATAPVGSSAGVAGDANTLAAYLNSPEVARIKAGNPLFPGAAPAAANNGNGSGSSRGNGQSNGSNGSGSAANAETSGANNQGQSSTSGQSGTGAGNSSSGNAASAGSSATSQNDLANQMWYQESLSLEQSRVESANDVIDGTALPLPETPLTPSNVDPRLVGPSKLFSDHFPTFQNTGSPGARGLNY